MEKKSKVIVDEVRGGEALVRLYQQNNQAGKATTAANRLIELNQHNKAYFINLLEIKKIDYKDPANIE